MIFNVDCNLVLKPYTKMGNLADQGFLFDLPNVNILNFFKYIFLH